MPSPSQSPLQRHQRKYRALADQLAAELATIGFISPGSVVSRYTCCGKPGCRCQGDRPQRHGPYYQWSRAVAGKTVSRRLDEREADLDRHWIANRRARTDHRQDGADLSGRRRATPGQTDTPRPPRPAKR